MSAGDQRATDPIAFGVARFREDQAAGQDVEDSVRQALHVAVRVDGEGLRAELAETRATMPPEVIEALDYLSREIDAFASPEVSRPARLHAAALSRWALSVRGDAPTEPPADGLVTAARSVVDLVDRTVDMPGVVRDVVDNLRDALSAAPADGTARAVRRKSEKSPADDTAAPDPTQLDELAASWTGRADLLDQTTRLTTDKHDVGGARRAAIERSDAYRQVARELREVLAAARPVRDGGEPT